MLSVFDYESDWTWWERHPLGDELVYLLDGEVVFLLDDGDSRWSLPLSPGTAGVVPKGTWHSAHVPEPSRVLFLTPTPAKTEHRSSTGRRQYRPTGEPHLPFGRAWIGSQSSTSS
jgi:mannose-6-phosphate isomerase-like protein (cupin superfamily)